MENNLEVIVKESGLEETKAKFLLDNFSQYFKLAAEWELKAKTIIVSNETQKAEMEMARVGRLFLRDKRIDIEKARKKLKEQSLREGKAIDGIANVLKALIEPIEEHLDKQEHFIEIKIKAEVEKQQKELAGKIELERLAKEKADREEQERIRLENQKLKEEADKKEKERLALEVENNAKLLKAEAEKKAIEDKARKAKEEAEKKAEAEKKKLLAEQEKLKAELAAQIECPHCHKKFTLNK